MEGRYIIERTDQGGGFVSLPGSKRTYTKDALKARRFQTVKEAEVELCVENERVIDVLETR